MQIIPVIDLLGGAVVHAKQGARSTYQPIQSQLTDSSEPLAIVAALLAYYPFTQLYIADLDAIQKLNDTYTTNIEVIQAIQQHFPQLTLWVDAGISCNTELSIWQKLGVRLVIGSENFASLASYLSLRHNNNDFILSLDFMPQGFVGPIELLEKSQYWPQEVIVMSLAHVGANQGANASLIKKVLARAPHHHLYVAGGIRNADDLQTLNHMRMKGTLIATALHQKQISKEAIAVIEKAKS